MYVMKEYRKTGQLLYVDSYMTEIASDTVCGIIIGGFKETCI